MAHAIMIKKLPHGLTLQDLDDLLERTDLKQHIKRRHIPKFVIDRRRDIGGPLAIAFAHFELREHAEEGINSLWHQCVWDRDAECDRRITADHTNNLWKPPTPEVSPEPLHADKLWEGKINKFGMNWRAVPTSSPSLEDADPPSASKEDPMAITEDKKDSIIHLHLASSETGNASTAVESVKDKKAKAKPAQYLSSSSNSWEKRSWDQSQWDTNSFHHDSDSWWTDPEDTTHVTYSPLQQVSPIPLDSLPRYRCIACFIPFMKWSQCRHHIITECLPVGKDSRIIDDDVDIKKICERLCAPFEPPNSPLAA